MKRRSTILVLRVSIILAAGLVVALVLRGWPGAGEPTTEFPDFVYRSTSTERAYRLAVEHPRLFAQVACYCGCGLLSDDPHHNLLDCFMNDDGTFDSHAVGCSLCLDIANDAAAWQARGESIGEIGRLVDEKYESVGPPTVQ